MKRRRRRRRMGNIQAPLKDGVNNDLTPLAGDRYLYSLRMLWPAHTTPTTIMAHIDTSGSAGACKFRRLLSWIRQQDWIGVTVTVLVASTKLSCVEPG